MMDSGAAERIVMAILGRLGEKRAPFALMASGYTLSIPVFFDTVFYLLIPLARSLWLKSRRNYLQFVCAIVAGAAVTHSAATSIGSSTPANTPLRRPSAMIGAMMAGRFSSSLSGLTRSGSP